MAADGRPQGGRISTLKGLRAASLLEVQRQTGTHQYRADGRGLAHIHARLSLVAERRKLRRFISASFRRHLQMLRSPLANWGP